MTVMLWRGTTDGDLAKAGNWIDASTGSSPGAGPANSDTLIFDWGSVDVDNGLTSGLTGITMIGTSGYTGSIAPGGHLSIALASLRWMSSGTLNLTGNITAGRVRCRSGSSFGYGGGTATSLYIERTDYNIAAAAVVTTGRAFYSSGSDLYNGTGYTLMEVVGGSHSTQRAGVFDVRRRGQLKVKTNGVLSGGSRVTGDSRIDYLSAQTISGEVEVDTKSTFDASGARSFTWSGTLSYWPGANINLDTAGGTVVPSTVNNYGLSDEVSDFVPLP